MSKKYIEFKKATSIFKRDSKMKECFHFNKAECSDNIIAAHSIQRNGVLSLVEDEIKGNLKLYNFLSIKYDEKGKAIGFEPVGKKTASTFSGFCGKHDTNLFQEIENYEIDLDNDKHCFLLSYRAFAKEFHSKQETLQGFKTNELYAKQEIKEVKKDMISGSELGHRDGQIVKNRLNEILKDENFDELEYFTYTLDYMVPITLATSFNPDYSYSNILLNKSIDPNVIYEFVNFSVIPTKDEKTLILFSCLPEQEKSVQFINELSDLEDLVLEKAISSIIIAYVENTFMSPKMWEKLGKKRQNQLFKELFLTNPPRRSMMSTFFHSKLNLFHKRYEKILPKDD